MAVHPARYDPELGQSEEDWALEKAAEWWQTWDSGHGAWIDINAPARQTPVAVPLGQGR